MLDETAELHSKRMRLTVHWLGGDWVMESEGDLDISHDYFDQDKLKAYNEVIRPALSFIDLRRYDVEGSMAHQLCRSKGRLVPRTKNILVDFGLRLTEGGALATMGEDAKDETLMVAEDNPQVAISPQAALSGAHAKADGGVEAGA